MIGDSRRRIRATASLSRRGFNSSNVAIDLYGKAGGAHENGLGLLADSVDHEITTGTYVQLDLANLWAQSPTTFSIIINSVQTGEGWNIYGSNAKGTLGTLLLGPGTTETSQSFGSIPNAYQFISVRADAGNVLLSSISADLPTVPPESVAPEPSSLVMIGSGLLAVALFRRRKRSS